MDLCDKHDLQQGGYTAPGFLVRLDPREEIWEETLSAGVRSSKPALELAADGTAAGVPVEAAVAFSLDKSMKYGAVLLCNTPVTRQGFAHEMPFRTWAKKNAKNILVRCPDARKSGFYVAITTWTSADVWTNTWTDTQREVSLGFKTRVLMAGEIAPSLTYMNGASGSGWIHPNDKAEV